MAPKRKLRSHEEGKGGASDGAPDVPVVTVDKDEIATDGGGVESGQSPARFPKKCKAAAERTTSGNGQTSTSSPSNEVHMPSIRGQGRQTPSS